MSERGRLNLDRMAIEEAGPNPERIAAAIHDQLALPHGPTPIFDIAKALDIFEIREAPLKTFEAALLAPRERGEGVILVNADSSRQRRRFSVAHELGHFLNVWHRPIEAADGSGFACRKEDMSAGKPRSRESSLHALQEAQANRFAIEVLAPRKFFKGLLHANPDLDAVLRLSSSLDLSRDAVARRYIELYEKPSALVFSRDRKIRYTDRHPEFPLLACRRDAPSPRLPAPQGADRLSNHEESDWRDWLRRPPDGDLVVQTLHQQQGFAITLLMIDQPERDDGA